VIVVKLRLKIKYHRVNNRLYNFEKISINGRYIYGYLCLLNAIELSEVCRRTDISAGKK